MQSPSSNDVTPLIMRGAYWEASTIIVSILALIRGLGNIYPTDLVLTVNKILD